jgi:hypothetical protein
MAIVEGVYFYRVFRVLFAPIDKEFEKVNDWLVVAPFILVLILVLMSSKPMYVLNFTSTVANQLVQRTIYLTSVLGGMK